ncbi:MAG: glycosyltransferase family 4 protein [Cyanobacteria bacterium J06560_6]
MSPNIIMTYPRSLHMPGGGTQSCLQIVEYLEKAGANVTLMPVSDQPEKEREKTQSPVVPVSPSHLHYLLDGMQMAKAIKRVLASQTIDAVISWEHEGAFIRDYLQKRNILSGMIAAFPSYRTLFFRNKNLRFLSVPANEWLRWRPLKLADVVFVSSRFTQHELANLFQVKPNKCKTIHRGIDPMFSSVARQQPDAITNFIFYGSLDPIKGIFDVIEALGQVATTKRSSPWQLKVAGWGNEAQVLESARQHGIGDRIELLGYLTPQELLKELAWAHLAILPSRAESFGRAIAEAQASGLPVVSYDAGSVPEIIEQGITGWLTPPGQNNQLAESIVQAIEQPTKTFQMGLAGHQRVMQRFLWELTAEALLEGIEEAKARQVAQSRLRTA